MSNFDLEDDLVLEYLAESREHLATIETDLLAIEQAGATIDEQLVNRVFRAAHSIKGGAGFFDLLKIQELAHRTESVLDLIRSGQMVPNSEIVSILLLAFDKLRSMILDHADSNNADIAEFTEALTVLTEEHLSPAQKSSTQEIVAIAVPKTGRLLSASAFDLDQARRGGKHIYVIEYDLIHDIQRRGKTPLEVLNQLIKCGSILATAFDLDSAGTLDDEPSNKLRLDVLYATVLDGYSVTQILDVPPERTHRIENDGAAAKSVAEPEAVVADPVPEETAPNPVLVPAREAAEQVSRLSPAAQVTQAETTVRLNVALLDSLMTLAGELVLGRNQLNEAVRCGDQRGIRAGAHRVSLVTSELQETVSLTRMQSVSSLFSKFPRLVRDLASELGKDIQLVLEGGDVDRKSTR